MIGKPAATPSILTRPVVLTAIAIVFVSAAAAGAWLTRPPAEAPPRVAKGSKARPAAARAATPAPQAPTPTTVEAAKPVDVPEAPPPPTSGEIARAVAPAAEKASEPPKPVEWSAMPIAELRAKAEANDIPAMEELARRLVQGIGVTKDQQAGAGWLLRAAQAGSPQSAFNVGVMYERGFVVERDSQRAVEWYRKAVAANLPMAKHNLALLLRDGKGVARNGKEAIELLRSATRQGMAASMFTLGDIYERGDAAPKDPATALAWFAITAEFERQMSKGDDTQLAKTASQRAQTLQRVLTPAELEKAQQLGQSEFRQIVEALQPPKPPPAPAPPPAPPPVETAAAPAPPPPDPDPPGWPKAANDQVRAIQQALLELKLLRDKPDGAMGPVTRNAIRAFQKGAAMRETGEPTKDVYAALKETLASRSAVASAPPVKPESRPEPAPAPQKAEPAMVQPAPLPAPTESPKLEATVEPPRVEPKTEPPKAEPAQPEPPKVEAKAEPPKPEPEPAKPEPEKVEPSKAIAKVEPAKPEAAKAELPKAEPPKAEAAKADPPKPPMPRIETEKPVAPQIVAKPEPAPAPPPPAAQPAEPPKPLEIGKPDPPPPPPTSADIARATPPAQPVKVDPDAWPTQVADQVKVVQTLLREMNFYREAPDGRLGPATRAAIREYERLSGLKVTGEPNKDVFESLKEMRVLMKPKAAASSN